MKKNLTKVLLLIMVAVIAVSTAACGLFSSDTDRLDTPTSITHTLNEETGENLVLSWMAVTNAQSYTVTIKKTAKQSKSTR